MGQEKIVIDCACGSSNHMIVGEYDSEVNCVYLSIHLQNYPIHARIWQAIKYIFGYKSKYGDFDEIVIDNEGKKNVVRLMDQIN